MYDSPNDLQRGMWEMWGFFDIKVFYMIIEIFIKHFFILPHSHK